MKKKLQEINARPLNEIQTSTILDCIVEGIFTVDKDLRITYFNHAAEKITGVPKKKRLVNIVLRHLEQTYARNHVPLQNL